MCLESKGMERQIKMFLMLESTSVGADVWQVSTKSYKQFGQLYGYVENWKRRGYSTVLDVMMVIINHGVYSIS